jgi:hypothetical protein
MKKAKSDSVASMRKTTSASSIVAVRRWGEGRAVDELG